MSGLWKWLPGLVQLLAECGSPWYLAWHGGRCLLGVGCAAGGDTPSFCIAVCQDKKFESCCPVTWELHADPQSPGHQVGLQCLVLAWVCPRQALYVMRGQAPMGSPKFLK